MKAESAGLLVYRGRATAWEVLLAHPGGPYFAHKDLGAWTIPKGAPNAGEALIDAARREFQEEIGVAVDTDLFELGSIRQRSGKVVHAWACQVDFPADFRAHSIDFEIEWPPGSGKRAHFPEVDRAEFFPFAVAARKIIAAQKPLLDRLEARLRESAT